MNSLTQALESQDVSDKKFREADLMYRYKTVTDAHGPSQVLIDFINHGKDFGFEIGLENFNNFSTTTQHEIMLSKMNPEAVEEVAMEGFVDFLKKYRGWLLLGGFIIPPLWLGSIIGFVANAAQIQVPKYSAYMDLKKDYGEAIPLIKKLISATPSGTDAKSWKSFESVADEINEKITYTKESTIFESTVVESSGWTPEKFSSEAKFLDDQIETFEKIREGYASKVEQLQKYIAVNEDKAEVKSTVKIMSRALADSSKSLHKVINILTVMKTLMTHSAKAFDFKK